MALVIGGKLVEVPGLVVRSWHDNPLYRLRMGQDGRPSKGRRVIGIVIHTTKGIPGGKDRRPQFVKPGRGPDGGADACARWWSTSPDSAGAHLVVDRDRDVACLADLLDEITFHAGHPNNDYTIGIEVYQDADAGIWAASIEATVVLVSFLCEYLDLPKQIAWPYQGGPFTRLDKPGGIDYRGVYGHRDCDRHRGLGDPGDLILQALLDAKFDGFDVNEREDIAAWEERQRQINAAGATPQLVVDGFPGPATYRAMRQTGLLFGGCVRRAA
jgi:hypothetical protein